MKTALVTGAVGDIGFAVAKRLQHDGYHVILSDLPGDALEQRAASSELSAIAADLGDKRQVVNLLSQIGESFDAPHIVVNAAGGVCGQTGTPLEHVTSEQWSTIFSANIDSAFHLAQQTLPAMQKAGSGRFITVSSGAGLKPSLTGIQAYTAAKHALVGLTKQLAMDYGQYGITVNSVAPGFILSNEATRRQWESYGEAGQANLINRIYMRRLGRPEDIASAVSFLASAESSWITGQILQVDGGTS